MSIFFLIIIIWNECLRNEANKTVSWTKGKNILTYILRFSDKEDASAMHQKDETRRKKKLQKAQWWYCQLSFLVPASVDDNVMVMNQTMSSLL